MAKILSLLIGAIVVAVGAIYLIRWWNEFISVAKAIVPILLILGGGVAVAAGLNELKDTLKQSKGKQ